MKEIEAINAEHAETAEYKLTTKSRRERRLTKATAENPAWSTRRRFAARLAASVSSGSSVVRIL